MLGNVLNDEQQFSKIDSMSRVQLLVDILGLAWIGKIDYQLTFDLVNYLQHETEFLPWKSALSTIHDINRMLLRTPTFGYFKVTIVDLLFLRRDLSLNFSLATIVRFLPQSSRLPDLLAG